MERTRVLALFLLLAGGALAQIQFHQVSVIPDPGFTTVGFVRFQDAAGTNYVSLKAPASLSGNSSFVLPTVTGVSGCWTDDGAGNTTINPCSGAPGNQLSLTNSASGTLTNGLTKLTGAPSTAIKTATTDVSGSIGICTSGCSTSGTASILLYGPTTCVFDAATTAGDYVQISSSVAGNCHDAGATYPTSGQVIGRVLSTNAAGGTYSIDLFSSEILNPFVPPISLTYSGNSTMFSLTDSGLGTVLNLSQTNASNSANVLSISNAGSGFSMSVAGPIVFFGGGANTFTVYPSTSFNGTVFFLGSIGGTHGQNIGGGDSPSFSGITLSGTTTLNGTVSGTHGQNVGTSDSPTFAGLTINGDISASDSGGVPILGTTATGVGVHGVATGAGVGAEGTTSSASGIGVTASNSGGGTALNIPSGNMVESSSVNSTIYIGSSGNFFANGGNIYIRDAAGASSGISCTSVTNGWIAVTSDDYIVFCDGSGSRFRVQGVSY